MRYINRQKIISKQTGNKLSQGFARTPRGKQNIYNRNLKGAINANYTEAAKYLDEEGRRDEESGIVDNYFFNFEDKIDQDKL